MRARAGYGLYGLTPLNGVHRHLEGACRDRRTVNRSGNRLQGSFRDVTLNAVFRLDLPIAANRVTEIPDLRSLFEGTVGRPALLGAGGIIFDILFDANV